MCSGDAGVYAMATLALELARDRFINIGLLRVLVGHLEDRRVEEQPIFRGHLGGFEFDVVRVGHQFRSDEHAVAGEQL